MKMKNLKYIILSVFACLSLSSCDLLLPGSIVNPNVSDDTFLESDNAMQAWVNGANRSFAVAVGNYCMLMEILSDNYFNNYSRSSQVFDIPRILYTDTDVADLQRYVGMLRETADYGLGPVADADPATTQEDLFNLYYIKAFSFILGGEHFRGLPDTEGGEIKTWQEYLHTALEVLDRTLEYAGTDEEKAFVHTLKARVYYRLGDRENASAEAVVALGLSSDFVRQVEFDGDNAVNNPIQEAVWGTWFQPLPRLDFLDPKYFQLSATEQRPINIAKAEENYLILAEASLAAMDEAGAKDYMRQLLALVKSRPVQDGINDQLEGRFNGGFKHYPDSPEYKVAASAGEPFREGLVLDRRKPALISIPYISGTSVTDEMIDNASGIDGILELLYLMRQEIFFAEGRRAADLGIRLPVCEVEAANNPSAAGYTDAVIPPFIPLNQGMDDFTMDEAAKEVTITYNMNRIIVENKSSEYVAPFFE